MTLKTVIQHWRNGPKPVWYSVFIYNPAFNVWHEQVRSLDVYDAIVASARAKAAGLRTLMQAGY